MKTLFLFLILFFVKDSLFSQDTLYASQIIKKLTSGEMLGRGYVNDGVNKAATFLTKEIKKIGLQKIGKSYSQIYTFSVNTFPKKTTVVVDGKELVAGKHYLIDPTSTTKKMGYQLFKIDSVIYQAIDGKQLAPIKVELKKKLTYTVATHTESVTTIELLKDSFPKDISTIDLQFENVFISKFKNQNICGYIKGTLHPDSFLVFTAHYDHLGAMGTEAYFPGANDNASGVSVLLNLAKYYKAHPSKYSIAFIFFSGEEAGLLGSKYYSEHPLFPLQKIKFLTNLDLLGTGNDGAMVVNASVFTTYFEKLNKINTEKKYLKQLKKRGKAANSDHYWFTEKGIPSFFIYTMGGIQAYHDIYDIEKTLPLTDYVDACNLLIDFYNQF